MKAIRITSDAQWRELRRQHVGGSECAALFGESSHTTRFELWHRKAGLLPEPDLSDIDRVVFGQIFESAIAKAVAHKTGWHIRKVRRYYSRLPELGQGASIDFEILGHDRGRGVLEIKMVDGLIARRWPDGEPPLSFWLQAQNYLSCTGWAWACLAVLVGGNDLRLYTDDRRPKTIELIEREIAGFWRSIADNKPPAPDYTRDSDAISALYATVARGKVLDLSGHNRIPELADIYQREAASEGASKRARTAAKAELLTIIGDAETVLCGDLTLRAAEVKGTPDRVIDQSLVGTIIKGRSGYRGLHVSTRKVEAA